MGSMKVDCFDEVLKLIVGFVWQEVFVGVFDSIVGCKDDGELFSNVEIGYIQEIGFLVNNIFVCLYFVLGVQDVWLKFELQFQKGVEVVFDGDFEQVEC